MTDRAQLAATIIRADGFCINAMSLPPTLGGGVALLAWKNEGGEVAKTWEGRGPDRYRNAVAEALGWELD